MNATLPPVQTRIERFVPTFDMLTGTIEVATVAYRRGPRGWTVIDHAGRLPSGFGARPTAQPQGHVTERQALEAMAAELRTVAERTIRSGERLREFAGAAQSQAEVTHG